MPVLHDKKGKTAAKEGKRVAKEGKKRAEWQITRAKMAAKASKTADLGEHLIRFEHENAVNADENHVSQ